MRLYEIVADRYRNIHKAAFRHLSLDQLKCLRTAIAASQQGRPLTSDEVAAAGAFSSAMAAECEKAGITIEDLARHNRQVTRPK
jgi:hypothetical protein